MSHKALAKISWLSPQEGGRNCHPVGSCYSTVARFEKTKARWPREAWSVVAEFVQNSFNASGVLAKVRFLSPEAPAGLLEPHEKFELFEGRRLVARCEVLKILTETDSPKLQDAEMQAQAS